MKTFSEFFGFKQTPFKRTPDVDFYYPTKIHQDALDTLFYMLQSDDAFTVITGEPGTGKTITLRKFISELPNNIVFAYILFPSLTPEELFMAILEDFNIKIDKNTSKNGLYAQLRDFLIEIGTQGKKAMIIIDEAQNMPLETLEELRILSNLETDKEKLLKIVLAGQPELDKKLGSEQLRQLSQRVTLYCKIDNMPEYEIKNYIYYHLSKAGKSSIKIQNKVIKQIIKLTQGNPRLINILMERTIIAAFLDNSYTVKDYHLTSAISSVNTIASAIKRQRRGVNPAYVGVAAAAAFILAVGGAYLTLRTPSTGTQVAVIDNQPAAVVKKETPVAKPIEDLDNQIASVATPEPTPIYIPNTNTASNNIQQNSSSPNVTIVGLEEPNDTLGEPIEMQGSSAGGQVVVAVPDNMMNANVGSQRPANNGGVVVNIITGNGGAGTNDRRADSGAPIVDYGTLAMPVGTKISISASILNLRASPSLKAAKVASVSGGEEYTVIAENDYWVQIRQSPTVTGWVYKGYLKIVK